MREDVVDSPLLPEKEPSSALPIFSLKNVLKTGDTKNNVWLIWEPVETFINMILDILFAKYILRIFFHINLIIRVHTELPKQRNADFSMTVSTLFYGYYPRNHGWCIPIEAYCQEFLLRIWRKLMINCE